MKWYTGEVVSRRSSIQEKLYLGEVLSRRSGIQERWYPGELFWCEIVQFTLYILQSTSSSSTDIVLNYIAAGFIEWHIREHRQIIFPANIYSYNMN